MEIAEISKAYDPKKVEAYWAEFWIKEGLSQPIFDPKKKTFVIVIPPPNVTGSLHMGHALNNTLQDIIIRWKKMCGFETLWVPGTDHGGIATQNVIEKLLKAEKKSRHDLGREKFLERLWQWRKESGDTILMQLRKLGALLDWSRTRFTMDEQCSQSVIAAFTELFNKGWIYRGKRMVNWCVRCQTALSDIEVEFEERKGKLYHIRYPLLSGKRDGWQGVPLVVATTRPETMLGDTAVAVHPEDSRYEKIHGWWVQLPLIEKEITIISDTAIDPKFGTGVVKVTPAHDMVDFEIGERHHLAQEIVIGYDGKMTPAAGKYAGLSREECRDKVIEDLKAQDLLEKVEEYKHSVGVCYRCNTAIEPLVSDQWFLKVEEMAKKAHSATKNGTVKIFPDSWNKPYLQWLEGLKDWCISRQIWWGHRIPVWYCVKEEKSSEHPSKRSACPLIVSPAKPEKCLECGGAQIEQDPDVLDTWFSSALWPFSVFGWPKMSADLERYYPTTLLVTGHEILYLWVARMVMMGYEFLGKEPFSHVFIHGIVRDKQGRKMSKSLGNVIDPLIMMDKFGTDALRYVLTSQSVPGRDMQISEDAFTGARNFANKIWNVSRFVQIYLKQEEAAGSKPSLTIDPSAQDLELCDRWILSRFQKTVQTVHHGLTEYNLALSARTLYQFIWSEFCDWYVELSKIRLLGTDRKQKETALNVCVYLLDGVLRLMHPIMPFISEEIYKSLGTGGAARSLLEVSYPQMDPKLVDESVETNIQIVMDIITAARTIRSEMDVPPPTKISLYLSAIDKEKIKLLEECSHYIQYLCKSEKILIGSKLSRPPKSATAILHSVEIYIPLEGLIDFSKERQRLAKELEQVQKELGYVEQRLAEAKFRKNAPAEEVSKTEERKTVSIQKLEKLKEHLALIQE